MELQTSTRAEPSRRGGSLSGGVFRDDTLSLVAVADSSNGGSLALAASQLALDIVKTHVALNQDLLERFARSPSASLRARIITVLQDAFGRAGREIFALGRRRSADVTVSVDLVLAAGDEAFVAHVGDGAVFLVRRGLLHRLTTDLLAGGDEIFLAPPAASNQPPRLELIDEDVEDEPSAQGEPMGLAPGVRAETVCIELQDGDRLLLAGGGVCEALPDDHLRQEIGDRGLAELLDHLSLALRSRPGGRAVLLAALQVGEERPPARQDPAAEARARLAVLARMPMFAHVEEAELVKIAGLTRPRTYRAGAHLLNEGQPGEGIYLLVAGQVSVLKEGKEIARISPGANFGEMSMLDDPRASATVRAATPVEVLVISQEAFFRLLKSNPTFAVKILWNMLLRLSANLRKTSARLADVSGD